MDVWMVFYQQWTGEVIFQLWLARLDNYFGIEYDAYAEKVNGIDQFRGFDDFNISIFRIEIQLSICTWIANLLEQQPLLFSILFNLSIILWAIAMLHRMIISNECASYWSIHLTHICIWFINQNNKQYFSSLCCFFFFFYSKGWIKMPLKCHSINEIIAIHFES